MNDLKKEVDELNFIYCEKTKNHLVIRKRKGNKVKVCFTGKEKNIGFGERFFGITNGYLDPDACLRNLKKCDNYGWLRDVVRYYG